MNTVVHDYSVPLGLGFIVGYNVRTRNKQQQGKSGVWKVDRAIVGVGQLVLGAFRNRTRVPTRNVTYESANSTGVLRRVDGTRTYYLGGVVRSKNELESFRGLWTWPKTDGNPTETSADKKFVAKKNPCGQRSYLLTTPQVILDGLETGVGELDEEQCLVPAARPLLGHKAIIVVLVGRRQTVLHPSGQSGHRGDSSWQPFAVGRRIECFGRREEKKKLLSCIIIIIIMRFWFFFFLSFYHTRIIV